jgi:3-methylcrotonyl-CoA carboxylase beta subunit
MYGEDIPAAGIITGIGPVMGRECVVVANDATVKGGTYYPVTVKKHLRAQEIARQNNLPCIYLVDSGGANLPNQDEVFPDREHFGRIFYNQATLSAAGVPQIAVVMGSCTAGGAYVPAMSDESIIVRNQGTIFLAGPPLVKAAIGEVVSAEELGGADVHSRVSGVTDHYALDDAHALGIARRIVGHLNRVKHISLDIAEPVDPLYDAQEIYGVVPDDTRKPYDVREVIARLVDGSDFLEFKGLYDQQTICGWAEIEGEPVAFIGNNGPITTKGSVKAAQFIQLCCQQGAPIVYLQNTTGYMVGTEAERGGIVKHGSKMIQAVANATVPQITIVIGGSFGAGNYGMCGRAYDPRFIFAWPTARYAVMSGASAAGTLVEIRIRALERGGRKLSDQEKEEIRASIQATYDAQTDCRYAAARLWVDAILDPAKTRDAILIALEAAAHNPVIERFHPGVLQT